MKVFRKCLALVLVMLSLLVPISSMAAAELPHTRFAVLGDSIASGYGLENIHDSYASLISAEKSYYLTNDAVPGHKTNDLLNVICNSKDARESVTNADVIAISIGGNDLIGLFANADTATILDIMLNGVNAKVVDEFVNKVTRNLDSACTEIRSLNPDAPIILQTIYNPLYANKEYGAYASSAEMFVPVMMEILDGMCRKYENVFTADVYTAFDNYYEENKSYDLIQSDGIHPSVKGHKLIAEVLTNKINELEKAGLISTAPTFYYLLGDADSNGKITISDATTIQKVVAGILTYTNGTTTLLLDATEDSSVNIKDATAIQKHLADLDTNPNIGTYLPYYGN